ncbi:hypothetical protein CCYN2B_140046 [Capnocytophaga cynodegmi]|uniref:Uncharacterized protein n=1 Tax=Capnocytophaga cynodegmi TaxID=28189 RepID=A0A0B7H585_9FLAO|nr:hypothetical protein CCYN2B_140046 [Capnocytophaga cynodegmi]CEN37258.1 hypothetical protein CCYN74_210076 [Capnocytophaga cynodegmi]
MNSFTKKLYFCLKQKRINTENNPYEFEIQKNYETYYNIFIFNSIIFSYVTKY